MEVLLDLGVGSINRQAHIITEPNFVKSQTVLYATYGGPIFEIKSSTKLRFFFQYLYKKIFNEIFAFLNYLPKYLFM